ncbi:small acid-soluble spore protein SspI [Lysinibacillus endophyticus]|uniref:Small, acid-soluble spore protein I n=1 Tax=Ureibacillus endophyticus TaxID=1978490 RepID=A0A494ZBF3_9BACL|nr:small acid-soluble spore protein SspI [Lysinibacillus endophyticus]MCP1145527.1 small acid-soluble spore protein SspI [Lysinibacillus endophyticus]RKQ20082.1 small acid-soluble spore protein SspI [Lysinibacillus endophyticus]
MNFQIRDAIKQNVQGDSAAEFRDTVQDAISRGDEHLLPGLGVFLEAWWKASSEEEHQAFTEKLSKTFMN